MTRQEDRAIRLYETWATGRTDQVPAVPFANLSDEEKSRWTAMAENKSIIDNDLVPTVPQDVQKYGDDREARPNWIKNRGDSSFDLWDYDTMLQETERDHLGHKVDGIGHRIPNYVLSYQAWRERETATTRKHWWQFNRPRLGDLSLDGETYMLWVRAEITRKNTLEKLAREKARVEYQRARKQAMSSTPSGGTLPNQTE